MGPQASGNLYSLLINKAIKNYGIVNNNQFPDILLFSIPVPDFISDLNNRDKALQMLLRRVRELDKVTTLSLSIVCNTAHLLLEELQASTSIPFISIIDEVTKVIKKQHLKKIGVLASPITLKTELYQKSLAENGIKSIIPNNSQFKELEFIIRNIINGKIVIKDRQKLISIADYLKNCGAQGIILGCTELPLLFPKKYPLPLYNSIDILADALLENYYKKERR